MARVVPLSLSPSNVTLKKMREKVAARRISNGHSFLAVFVSRHAQGPSKRRTTRSLLKRI